jgi:hypothetical protein
MSTLNTSKEDLMVQNGKLRILRDFKRLNFTAKFTPFRIEI